MSFSNPHDDRPFISDLLVKHSVAIEAVRSRIQADNGGGSSSIGKVLYNKGDNAKRYDDIWILRFVLSHKGKDNVKSAAKAAIRTMKFREDKKLNEVGDLRPRIQNHGDAIDRDRIRLSTLSSNGSMELKPLPGFTLYDSFCGEHCAFQILPDTNRGLVVICDAGQIDMEGVIQNMTEEAMTEKYIYLKEAFFQVADEVTRRTGRLTKQMNLIDLGNVTWKELNRNRAYVKRDAKCAKALEDYYPQLLGTSFIANSPAWLSGVWSVFRSLFPKRVVEKVDFLPPLERIIRARSKSRLTSSSRSPGASSADYLNLLKPILRYISEEHLPVRYGGRNEQWPLPSVGSVYDGLD